MTDTTPPDDRHGRAPESELRRQAALFAGEPLLAALLDAVPALFVILNDRRQIVFANKALLEFFSPAGPDGKLPAREAVCGLHMGEAIGCGNAGDGTELSGLGAPARDCPTSGAICGEGLMCRFCGHHLAIGAAGQRRPDVQEYRLIRRDGRGPVDMRVWTTPLERQGELFVVCAMLDVSHEKRRRALERVFFHDTLNTVAVLYGMAALTTMAETRDLPEVAENMRRAASRLVDEIKGQQLLLDAENRDLALTPEPIKTRELLEERAAFYRVLPAAKGVEVLVHPGAEDAGLVGDRAILGRALGNLLKNAIEAAGPGGRVTLDCRLDGDAVEFSVHGPAFMPPDVQLQVFQRSFSTKGRNRGLGTYSARLLVEGYLGGKVWFVSTPAEGTTFRLRCPVRLGPRGPERPD